ncbi:dCTP deaminase, partial [Candidatus Woesearchaeota archaeon]|nr:dCTP deaminase [Candidatus Woesearchaeota archaeon]
MVLTRDVILKEIRNKKVKVTPFNKANLGPASLDLT